VKHSFVKRLAIAAGLTIVAVGSSVSARQQAQADLILTNGKIITVDERFSIAQAVAVRGDRIIAVGTNQEISRLASPGARRIDLRGRSVIPGLIDHHAHLWRAAATWDTELRLDGVDSRKTALDMVRAKARSLPAGEWVHTIGGFSIDQFADDPRPFTREELDAASADHPVLLQFTRSTTYLNSRALQLMGIDDKLPAEPWVEREPSGRPTGRINEPGLAPILAKLPPPAPGSYEASALLMVADMNRAGLTAAGVAGCPAEQEAVYQKLRTQNRLNMRFYCQMAANTGGTAESVEKGLPEIEKIKLFQGDEYINHTAYGEAVFQPLHDNMLAPTTAPRPDQLVLWRRIATEIARNGMPLIVHATIEGTFAPFLDQIEAVTREYPVNNLRWALAHMDQVQPSHLERMKKLNMYAAVRAIPPVMGKIFSRAHGERSRDMPPLRMIQDSGIMWGFHSDTTEVNQYRPFTTLWFAVTGKMVGGAVVNRQPITREEALIAHTRHNAFFVFQENNLGSIAPGKLADLVVMDRDYLTVPADQIKDIKPTLTMVGGRVVYDAAAPATTTARR
jgi:predicted amidohydrolase YtcJ